ncbi:hypothetical protein pb186bvf_003708 [Paramecium bursaria]
MGWKEQLGQLKLNIYFAYRYYTTPPFYFNPSIKTVLTISFITILSLPFYHVGKHLFINDYAERGLNFREDYMNDKKRIRLYKQQKKQQEQDDD